MATTNNSGNSLLATIGAINSGKRVPVMKLVAQNTELAATISKLRRPRENPQHTPDGTRVIRAPDLSRLQQIGSDIARNIDESRVAMEMLPDMKAAMQILVSGILSPKDMMTVELIYGAPEGLVPPNIATAVTNTIRTYFDQHYKIKQKLPTILREILFDSGSYILAVIPENSVDELINRDSTVSMESLNSNASNGAFSNLGLLGSNKAPVGSEAQAMFGDSLLSFGLESLIKPVTALNIDKDLSLGFGSGALSCSNISVVDNSNVLKIPKLQEKLRQDRLKGAVKGYGMESVTQSAVALNDRNLTNLLYKRSASKYTAMAVAKSQNQLARTSVSRPMILRFPSDSVIPVIVPGQEDKHVGYFVLLDQTGNPLSASGRGNSYRELANNMNSLGQGGQQSQMMSRLSGLVNGFNCDNMMHMQTMANTAADLVEQDLLARLRNGIYNNGVSLARSEELDRLMLSRVLSQQQTQILFLPVEMVTYFALRYNKDGIGVSLMDEMKIINNMRSVIMFSNTMGAIRNSIGRTVVDIKLDPEDPDPQKTFEMMMHEVARNGQEQFPLGADSPTDIVRFLQRAQYMFKTSGHPGMPDIGADISETSSNYVKVDTELEEQLRRRSIAATGLNVSTVDNGFDGETATSVVSNNILLSRRVMTTQDEFTPLLTDHIVKVVKATSSLVDELRAILIEKYDELGIDEAEAKELFGESTNQKEIVAEKILNDFLQGMEVTLPRPNTVSVENQYTALETYTKLLDVALKAWIDSEFFTTELSGEITNTVTAIYSSVRAYYIRAWMAENGVMTELFKIGSATDNGEPEMNFWEAQSDHMKNVMASFAGFMVKMSKPKIAVDTVMTDLEQKSQAAKEQQEAGGDTGDSGGFDSAGDSPSGADDSGGDDFDMSSPPDLDIP